MIEKGMDRLVAKAKKEKKWKPVPDAPRAKLIQLQRIYEGKTEVTDALKLYDMFREIDKLEKVRESEFRKGVNLRVTFRGEVVNINLLQLKDYANILERFISYIK